MSLCIKVEHAFANYLLTKAQFLISEKAEWIVEDNALRLRTATGFEITEPIEPSVSDRNPLTVPNVVAECSQMVERTAESLNFDATIVIRLTYPGSPSAAIPNPIGSFEFAANELAKALYDPGLPALLMANEEDFTCFNPGIAAPRQESHAIVGKLRIYEFTLQLCVARGDLTAVPVP